MVRGRSAAAAIISAAALLGAFSLVSSAAWATDGYFQDGYGARQKALGGAGAADGTDATSASLNPAGIVHTGNEFEISVSAFDPRRSFTGSGGPGFTPTGTFDSKQDWFAIPNLAASWKLKDTSIFDTMAFTIYGNGGMNTTYPASIRPVLALARRTASSAAAAPA